MAARKTKSSSSKSEARGKEDPVARQAASHRHTREAHTTELAEDYVEIINNLIEEQGEARVVDIAKRLGVTQVTVTRAVARLQRDGLVSSRPYRAIFLTDPGIELAKMCERRHRIVVEFLRSIGVPAEAAERDAEGIEHHVGDETLRAFERHLKSKRDR